MNFIVQPIASGLFEATFPQTPGMYEVGKTESEALGKLLHSLAVRQVAGMTIDYLNSDGSLKESFPKV